MALKTAGTKYSFRCVDRRHIHDVLENHGTDGLRRLADVVRDECEAIEQLAQAIDDGECYSPGPEVLRTWWGWG